MNEAVTWAALAAAIVAVISVITFWTKYSDRITLAEAKADEAAKSERASSILASGLGVKIDQLQQAFADYRESAALKFVSNHDLVQVETRFADLAEQIKRDIRGVTERLDRVLEHRNGA